MRSACRDALPTVPLLHAYAAGGMPTLAEMHRLPGLGPRFAAVLSATVKFLHADFLDTAAEGPFRDAISRFYEAVVSPPLHADTLRQRVGFVRHAIVQMLRGRDPLPVRMAACLSATGVYRVAGLGPAFWSAVAQGLAPARHPGWTSLCRQGALRLGLRVPTGAGPAEVYACLQDAHDRIRRHRRELTAVHTDHFLSLVAVMPGRNLHEGASALGFCPVEESVRQVRATQPLRQRLKERGQAIAQAQQRLEAGLAARDGKTLGDALAAADPTGSARCPLDWGRYGELLTLWVGRLWESDDPYPLLGEFWRQEPLPGAGLWLPAAVLHLRDPQAFSPWADSHRQGLARIDDGIDPADSPAERYRLHNEAAQWLRARHNLHPLEVPAVLEELVEERTPPPRPPRPSALAPRPATFRGFCPDTFTFLRELARENRREWMDRQRDRYHFAVRGPLTELCEALAARYVEPVLEGVHGWRLETASRGGRALTRVSRNAFGRGVPYTSTLWITFCRAGTGRDDAQLFVRLGEEGVRYGLRLGPAARAARARLRAAVEQDSAAIHGLLGRSGALDVCRFGPADRPEALGPLDDAAGLLTWSRGRTQEASVSRPAGDELLCGDDLVGEVILTFDRLLPLYAACVEESPPDVRAWPGGEPGSPGYAEADFLHETYLGADWLGRARELLALKKQLILQGVPGTGKTHVARCLARLLAGGQDDAVRLVQFHPAYSYEEFVEGIRVRSVSVDGRHDVTYPVEDGLLCAFAARAADRPGQPHVLVIDEINRGNLPRIFGELLYLLEYRGHAVELPCSRRSFRLPDNLYLLGTMNAADRSIAPVDQALRRRFSFLEMTPDAGVLSAWLRAHPPAAGPTLVARVLALFERLNARLRAEAGPHAQVGHSYFMVPRLDEARLRLVWQHHVRPLLDEFFAGQPGRAAAYDALLESEPSRPRPARQGAVSS